jgi:hypothetical protein
MSTLVAQSVIIMNDIYKLGNTTGVCSATAIEEQINSNAEAITAQLSIDFLGGLFLQNSEEIPEGLDAATSAGSEFGTVYLYFWISFVVVLFCSMIFLQLVRKKRKADLFDSVGMTTRSLGCIVCMILIILGCKENADRALSLLSGPYIVPIVVLILFGVLSGDQFSRIFCNWRLKHKGLLPDEELRVFDHQHESGDHFQEGNSEYDVLAGHENNSAESMQAPSFNTIFPTEQQKVHFRQNEPGYEHTTHV